MLLAVAQSRSLPGAPVSCDEEEKREREGEGEGEKRMCNLKEALAGS